MSGSDPGQQEREGGLYVRFKPAHNSPNGPFGEPEQAKVQHSPPALIALIDPPLCSAKASNRQ